MLVVVTLLICQNPAQAAAVRLCDNKIQNVVKALEFGCDQLGISIWGTEYYTHQGVRRCELHFGNTDKNTIRFRLNNDDTIARALVTVRVTNSSNFRTAFESGLQGGTIAGLILYCSNVSKYEVEALADKVADKFLAAFESNPYMTHYHEKTSLWCPSIYRYVVWDYEVTDTHLDIYLYAHD